MLTTVMQTTKLVESDGRKGSHANMMLKSAKFGREICIQLKFNSENENCCVEKNHSYMSYMYAKEFSDLNFNEAVIGKILIFQKIAPNFT